MYPGLIFKAELPPGVRDGAFRAYLKVVVACIGRRRRSGVRNGAFRASLEGAGIGATATAPGKDGYSQGRMPLTQSVQDRGVDAALEP